MKIIPAAFAVLLSIAAAFITAKYVGGDQRETAHESIYERVIRTGTLRCGYFSWYPAIIKDPATGEFKGIFYDYVNELGKSLGLKIDWAEEVALGEAPAALESGRIDAFCSAMWITGERARGNDFVMPVYYLPLYVFARKGDTRFAGDLMKLDDEQYTMAVLEGGATSTIRRKMFPRVKAYELPQFTSPAELFTTLAAGKADAAIYDLFTYGDFNSHNPDKIEPVSLTAVKVFPNVMAVKRDEQALRRMLSNATLELHLSGTIERIIAAHEKYPRAILRLAKPYQAD